LSEGTLVVSGSVLQIRRTATELPPGIADEPVTLPGPEAGRRANVKKDVNSVFSA